jgi:hypothetical protein
MLCRKHIFQNSAEQQAIAAKLHHTSRQPPMSGVLTREDRYWLFVKKIQDLQKVNKRLVDIYLHFFMFSNNCTKLFFVFFLKKGTTNHEMAD